MTSSELLIILVVAIVVFGPKKLPMLAEHLAKLVKKTQQTKQQLALFWQEQLQEDQLRKNQQKADKADSFYQEPDKE